MVVKALNSIFMSGASALAKKIHKLGIPLADFRFLNAKTDVVTTDCLIGNDNYRKLVSPVILPKQVYGMWLPFTIHGQAMLSGRIQGSSESNDKANVNNITILNVPCVNSSVLKDGESVEDFNAWEVARELNSYESLGIRMASRQDEDNEARVGFESNFHYDDTGKPTVGFPWVAGEAPSQEDLDSNCEMVRSRFDAIMKTLDKDPERRAQYEEVHRKEVDSDFVERVGPEVLDNPDIPKHWIHSFPVYKTDPGATTKCRRVFDASLHRRGGRSLNDMLFKGEKLTPHILEVCLRLRLLQYLLTADISKAFMRMGLKEADRNYTLFFVRKDWKDPNSEVLVFRFKSVLFGATSSPFLLNCTIADILGNHDYPEFLEVFVDNLFTLVDKPEKIRPSIAKLQEIFHATGMPLHEFCTNIPEENKYLQDQGLLTDSAVLKVLGMRWDYSSDVWYLAVPSFELVSVTKRSVLSDIARLFDPCGFLSPITIMGRLIVQAAWEADLTWDEQLPQDMQEQWRNVVKLLEDALTIPIPRWIGIKNLQDVSIHVFSDASERALGVVVYLVQGESSVMYTAKSKSCPIKMQHFTIPRKELTAFSLGARYAKSIVKTVSKYFNPTGVHLWSDSTTTLQWVTDKNSHRELYIRSRVDEIVKKIRSFGIIVHYILGSQNPSDLLTKPSVDPLRSELWQHGPPLLRCPEQWQPFTPAPAKLDAIPIHCGVVGLQEDLPSVEDFDSVSDLFMATARRKQGQDAQLQPSHIAEAELSWIKQVQKDSYPDVLAFLTRMEGAALHSVEGKKKVRSLKLDAPSICHNLHLCLDGRGIIRVQTSLQNAPNLTFDQKCPMLLPSKALFTNLIIKKCHNDVGHFGLNYTRAQLRRRFWVPNVTCTIKRVVAACPTCKIERGRRYHIAESPPLPEFRFDVADPFSVVALDMTGHEWVSNAVDKSVSKVYFIFFVCMATGCGHVEMTDDASSSSFANAFDRFTSRRGVPHLLVSDHGANFTGYSSELQSLAEDSTLESFLFQKGIQWKFTPIGAPHFNGYCERSISLLKSVIRKSIRNRVLSRDQLLTVACYAESCFNERPLCIMDSDVDFVPITPNMLVYGKSLRQFAHSVSEIQLNDPDFEVSGKKLTVMARKLKSTLAQVRKTFQSEYLHFLATKDAGRQAQSPATKSRLLPAVGDGVLIKDGKDMRLGKIVELVISGDGECRSARVKTQSGSEGVYPTCNLRLLERGEDPRAEVEVVRHDFDAMPNKRPKRKAAAKAQMKFLQLHLLSL